ncbi:MAG TPA: alanine racemase [Erysipelotrichaceae bacterium]|nr:alanine racemase [Erysipelotrichaceae bacterium]
MFLEIAKENNPKLIEFAFKLQQEGQILPDTYVLDYDTIIENGRKMKVIADSLNIKLFFMTKQIGRNPEIARGLMEIGFDGVVAVDFKETLTMIKNGIRLGNVGHLVQIPQAALKTVIENKPIIMTVYNFEMIEEINSIAKKQNHIQDIMPRVVDEDSFLYDSQQGGFDVAELSCLIDRVKELKNVRFAGLTVFPAFLYDKEQRDILPTVNMQAMEKAVKTASEKGYNSLMINMPSVTCCQGIETIHKYGGNCGEPGHGLTGTTPLHKDTVQPEKIGYVYVSEISHTYKENSHCYGGGFYRRGGLENALVGTSLENCKMVKCSAADNNIDYHFKIHGKHKAGSGVIICYRTQAFTTRSQIAVVKGLKDNKPELSGLYSSLGEKIEKNW